MPILHAETALLPDGWIDNVTVHVGPDGRIAALRSGQPDHTVGILLPAPGNVHSHAFQRAMAGLTEARGPSGSDSFWTWRQLMFRFLEHLTPDDIEIITAYVQMEMLEAGFAAVGEFHYLHHQPGGKFYANIAETSARICAAADRSGIGLTLLPLLYQTGGVDGRGLGPGQARFGTGTEAFFHLLTAAAMAQTDLPEDAVLGLAPHSLRAVPRDVLRELPAMTDGPLHMHLAEQEAEVAEITAAYGQRPVDWLLDHCPPDARWCLIHCTQMTPAETTGLAATGAVAGLCPITEASLGDGIFDGASWMAQGGRIALGSDSNIHISLAEEIRQLEYSQRLRDKARAVLADPQRSTGRFIWEHATSGAAQALDRDSGRIAPGYWADLVAFDADNIALVGRRRDAVIDSFMVGNGSALLTDVWAAGRHMVRDGRHIRRDTITQDYGGCLRRLAEHL